jgi:uncharacterized protein YegP (UPF0339 family)
VVCLVPENQGAPWLLFEAGALSKTLDSNTLLIPYLTEMTTAQLAGPLAQFQAVTGDESGTFSLLLTLNKALGSGGIPQNTLEESFEVWWPRLASELVKLPPLTEPVPATRTDRDLLDEILENTREQLRREEAHMESAVRVSGVSTPGLGVHYGYEVFQTADGNYRWRIVRGQAVTVSDAAYASPAEASEAAAAVRDTLATSEIVEVDDGSP